MLCTCLLILGFLPGGVNHIAASNGALVHEVVYTLELREADGLEWRLDKATAEELDGLGAVFAVTDVRTLDGDLKNALAKLKSRPT